MGSLHGNAPSDRRGHSGGGAAVPAKYGFQASPDTRSIGATLVHIAVSTGFQDYIQRNKVTDLKDVNFMELFQKFSAEEAKPRTKAETIAYLKDHR